MTPWQLWIIRVIDYLLGKCLFGSLLQLRFFLLLSIPLSRFSWFCRQSLWLHVIFCTFGGSLLSRFTEPCHMPFCSQSRSSIDFSVWSCSHLGCANLCKVTLRCLWFLCSILSVRQKTNCGLLVSSKSLPLFVQLIFSTSSVGKLWVCNCLGRFLCLGPFGSMWSFLWSSIRVRVLFVWIWSFQVLVCLDWRWIFWTRNHVFHYGLAFSNLILFLVLFWALKSFTHQC